ncbi:prolipoprotein diacylglyceryl transferase family protein [Paenibacillus sp. YSY-4.3]
MCHRDTTSAIAKRVRQTGLIASLYLLLYSAGRFVIEFYRGDIIRGSVGVLSTSQWIAIVVFIFTCVVLLPMLFKSMKAARQSTTE